MRIYKVICRANESLFKTQFVPLNISKGEQKNSFFNTMTDLSKISNNNRTRLFESKDFGNYTIHSRSFSLYDPINQLSRRDEPMEIDPKQGSK